MLSTATKTFRSIGLCLYPLDTQYRPSYTEHNKPDISVDNASSMTDRLGEAVDTYLRLAQPELQHLQGLADHVGLLLHQDALLVLLQAAQRAQQALQDGVVLLLQGLQPLDHLFGPGDDLILGQLLPRVLLLLHAHHGGHVLTHPAD